MNWANATPEAGRIYQVEFSEAVELARWGGSSWIVVDTKGNTTGRVIPSGAEIAFFGASPYGL